MSPDYSVKWWKKHRLYPPDIDPQSFLEKKIAWRYAKGVPEVVYGDVLLGDSSKVISTILQKIDTATQKPFQILFTSPPYIDISDYHRDQWLRLWMLGNSPIYSRSRERYKNTFSSPVEYKSLLSNVFIHAADMMSKSGHVYVRTDAREQTFEITNEVLVHCFPKWKAKVVKRPYEKETQTALYGDKASKPGEVDIILSGPSSM